MIAIPRSFSVGSFFPPFDIVDKRLIGHACAARGRIVACKIPVAFVLGAGGMQPLDVLVNDFHPAEDMFGPDNACDLFRYFIHVKGLVDTLHVICLFLSEGFFEFFFAIAVDFINQRFHAAGFEQANGCPEGATGVYKSFSSSPSFLLQI